MDALSAWEGAGVVQGPAFLELLARAAETLHRLHVRVDPVSGQPLGFLHRNPDLSSFVLEPDGRVVLTDLDAMKAGLARRRAQTVFVLDRPGRRMAPEEGRVGEDEGLDCVHETDIYKLVRAMARLLLPRPMFAGFEAACDTLFEAMHADPRARPSGRLLAEKARANGADAGALRHFALERARPGPASEESHLLAGTEGETRPFDVTASPAPGPDPSVPVYGAPFLTGNFPFQPPPSVAEPDPTVFEPVLLPPPCRASGRGARPHRVRPCPRPNARRRTTPNPGPVRCAVHRTPPRTRGHGLPDPGPSWRSNSWGPMSAPAPAPDPTCTPPGSWPRSCSRVVPPARSRPTPRSTTGR